MLAVILYPLSGVLTVAIICLTVLVAGGLRGITVTVTFRWKGETSARAGRKAAPAEAARP